MSEIPCASCNKHFKQKKNLYAHMRNTHGINPALTGSLLCPVENCTVKTHKYERLRNHLATSHSVKCEKEVIKLKSWEEFIKWKQAREAAENNSYVLSTGSVTLASKERKTYYSCHRTQRSGAKSKQPYKGTRKSPGTKKILKTCPSTIEASVNKRGVAVVRWKTHWGHFEDTSNVESNLCKLFNSPSDHHTFSMVTDYPNTECGLLSVHSACDKSLTVTSKVDIPEKLYPKCVLNKSCEYDIGISASVACMDENVTSIVDRPTSGKLDMATCSILEKEAVKKKIDLLHNHISTNQFTVSQCFHLNKILDQCLELCTQSRTICKS